MTRHPGLPNLPVLNRDYTGNLTIGRGMTESVPVANCLKFDAFLLQSANLPSDSCHFH
jgi:hypothetical protein